MCMIYVYVCRLAYPWELVSRRHLPPGSVPQFRLAHRVVEASGSDDKVSEIRRRALCGVLEIKVIALDAQLRFVQHCVADDLVVAEIHATRLVSGKFCMATALNTEAMK